jgi:uncharacterized protein (DUF1330 family)
MTGRRQSEGLLDAHFDNRVLMFPSVTSMVVGSTIFNVKNGLLENGSQRLPSVSVIWKPPSVVPLTDLIVLSAWKSPRISNRLFPEKIINLGKGCAKTASTPNSLRSKHAPAVEPGKRSSVATHTPLTGYVSAAAAQESSEMAIASRTRPMNPDRIQNIKWVTWIIAGYPPLIGYTYVTTTTSFDQNHQRGAKAYWIATYRSIKNPEALDAYAKLAGPAIWSAGGRNLVRGTPAKTLKEGLGLRTVVIEFESVAAAVAAYESDAYQTARRVLGDGAVRHIRIVEGMD